MQQNYYKMKKTIAIILMAVGMALSTNATAQTFGGPEYMKHKTVVGGNFGLGFYGNSFYVGLAPQIGYRLTRSLEAGVRLGYDLHYYYRDYAFGNYFCHYFSGSAYLNYEIFSGIYLQAEDEEMCLLVSGKALESSASAWYNSVLVGAGYRQYWGNSYTYYSIFYNLSWDYNSPYNSPFIVRVGYCYGF